MHASINSPVETSQRILTNEENSQLQVRIHGVDGSLATFTQEDPAIAEHIVPPTLEDIASTLVKISQALEETRKEIALAEQQLKKERPESPGYESAELSLKIEAGSAHPEDLKLNHVMHPPPEATDVF